MEELRNTVAGIRGDLESFGSGVTGRIGSAKSELEALASGIQDTIASIRPDIESALAKLSGQIDALESELKALEP
jgi:hypothetical protein